MTDEDRVPGEKILGEKPKTFSHFKLLSPGCIKARGWIHYYLQVISNGLPLLCAKEEIPEVYSTFWKRNGLDCVFKGRSVGYYWDGAPDYPAYFGDGMVHLVQLVPHSELAKELDPWLKQVLASQDSDGYLGAVDPPNRWHQWLDVFSQGLMTEALLYRYECTGDVSLLEVCKKAAELRMQVFCEKERFDKHLPYAVHGATIAISGLGLYKNSIFGIHGTSAIRAMLKLYAHTGKTRYLEFARDVMERYGRVKEYLRYYQEKDSDERTGNPWPYSAMAGYHLVVESQNVGLPAILYEYTGDKGLLESSLAAWKMMQPYIGIDGAPQGDGILEKKRPRVNAEHCGSVEWSYTNHELLRMTGDIRFADAAERAMFNGYPAAKSPDTRATAYLHSANQLVAGEWSTPGDGFSVHYFSTAHRIFCCNVNSPRAMPYYVEKMVMQSAKGLSVVYYGPCRIRTETSDAGVVELVMDTEYPFGEEVNIVVNADKEAVFPLRFRIPEWSSSTTIELNGKLLATPITPGEFAAITRKWCSGDVITIRMDIPIRLEKYPETGIRVGGAAVIRGPLTFVLPVPEEWVRFDADPLLMTGPGKDVMSYRVIPGENARWNYALMIDEQNLENSFSLKTLSVPAGGRPWEYPPIGLEVQARRVLNWEQEGSREHPVTPGLPLKPMRLSNTIEQVVLVPFGFTRLRMSYLPLIEA